MVVEPSKASEDPPIIPEPASAPLVVVRSSDLQTTGTSVAVVEHLRGLVHQGVLNPGERLPPERELAAALGVGRVTLRAALHQLASEGYVVARRGATGGTFVTDLRRPYEHWREEMRRNRRMLDEVFEVRLAVEPAVAALAAERRTDAEVAELRRVVHRPVGGPDRRAFRRADAAFHRGLAAAARNERLAAIVEDARAALFVTTEQLEYDEVWDELETEHGAIVDAVERRRPGAAAAAMTAHLEASRRVLHDLLEIREERHEP